MLPRRTYRAAAALVDVACQHIGVNEVACLISQRRPLTMVCAFSAGWADRAAVCRCGTALSPGWRREGADGFCVVTVAPPAPGWQDQRAPLDVDRLPSSRAR
jgi:hypothetical protein